MSMGGSSGGGGSSTTTTEPWSGLKPYLTKLYGEASTAYDKTSKDPYTGETVAPQSTYTTQAKDSLLGTVGQQTTNAGLVQNYVNDIASGKYMDASTNPYLKSAMTAATNETTKNFNENVLPKLTSAAISGGAYGGARNGIVNAKSAADLNDTIANNNAKIAYQNYSTERGYQNNLPSLVSSANTLTQAPSQTLATVGAADEAYQQSLLDAAYDKWYKAQSAPWNGVSELANALGSGSGYNSRTTNLSSGSGSKASSILSGGIGGALAGNAIAEAFPITFGLGANAMGATGLASLGALGPIGVMAGLGMLAGGLF